MDDLFINRIKLLFLFIDYHYICIRCSAEDKPTKFGLCRGAA